MATTIGWGSSWVLTASKSGFTLFQFGERTGIDLPRESSGTAPRSAPVKENITRNVMKRRKLDQGGVVDRKGR
jgi:hypothetical protein